MEKFFFVDPKRDNHSDNKTGVGIAILSRMLIVGEGVTLPPLGVAWPVLLWFAKDSLGGAGNELIGGYTVWGPSTGVAIPFVGLEVTGFEEGKVKFVIIGFTLLSMAFGENVTQIPPPSQLHKGNDSECPTTSWFDLLLSLPLKVHDYLKCNVNYLNH